jgi:hypothetical protein
MEPFSLIGILNSSTLFWNFIAHTIPKTIPIDSLRNELDYFGIGYNEEGIFKERGRVRVNVIKQENEISVNKRKISKLLESHVCTNILKFIFVFYY